MEKKDIRIGMEYKIIDSEKTDEWLRMYGREGLRVGQIMRVDKISDNGEITDINVTNIKDGNRHGISHLMLGEIFIEIEGVVDF